MGASKRSVYPIACDAGTAARLADAGHAVRPFRSASAFIEEAESLRPGCILIEIGGGESVAAIAAIRHHGIAMPLIAQAVRADVALAVSAMKAGANDFLVLPHGSRTLERALADAFDAAVPPPAPIDKTAARDRLGTLTSRERQVLSGLVRGLTNKMIGEMLGISPRTVEVHRARLMRRLGAKNMSELVVIALAAGVRPHVRLRDAE